jgi:hypothetical protein
LFLSIPMSIRWRHGEEELGQWGHLAFTTAEGKRSRSGAKAQSHPSLLLLADGSAVAGARELPVAAAGQRKGQREEKKPGLGLLTAAAAARVAVADEAQPAPDRPAGCSALFPAARERARESNGDGSECG